MIFSVHKMFHSSIGCKLVMALTGLALVGFLIAHLLGNLLVFGGPEALNNYAQALHSYGAMIWIPRLALIAIFLTHIYSGLALSRLAKQSSPISYKIKNSQAATLSSKTMALSGLVVLSFVLYHLAHLTFKVTHPEFQTLGEFDVYQMLILSFQNPLVSFFYILSIVLLMMHLNHGIKSLFQTLGIYHKKYNALIKYSSLGLSTLLALGFIAIPLSIFAGLIK